MVENRNFGQKSTFWPKIEILVKNLNFGKQFDYLGFYLDYLVFFDYRYCDQRSKFGSNIEMLVTNQNFIYYIMATKKKIGQQW